MREGWREVTLGELSPGDGLQTGPFGSQLKASEYTAWGVPVVMPKDMTEGRILAADAARVPEEVADRLAKHRVRPGDILFGRRGELGRCGLVTHEQSGWLCGTGCLRFRPTSDISPDFLIQLLGTKTTASWLEENAVGQTMLNLNTEILGRLPIVLPPLPEQRKIAAILSSVDEAIEKSSAVIDQLEVVKKALMQNLLTRGLPGRHTKFKQTEIGEIPEGWELLPLEQVAEVRTGAAKNSKKLNGTTRPIPYLRVANVQDGHLDLAEIKTIDVDDNLIDRYALKAGDVLFTEGGDADKLGRGTVWRGELPLCLHQNHVFAVRPSKQIVPEFLSFYGGSERGKAYFLDCAKQTTNLASINSTQLKALPVPVPSIGEQRKLVAAIDSVVFRLRAERDHQRGLRNTKAGLLTALLSGEVRVPLEQEAA